MNPEQNNTPQPQNNQQPYQNPTVSPQQQVPSPEQLPVSHRFHYPNEQPKQTNKSRLILVISAFVVLGVGVAVGIFILLGSESKSQSSSQTNQSNDTKYTAQKDTPEKSGAGAQTDTQNKSNLSKLVVAISEYSTNNNGKLPAGSDIDNAFISQYLSGQFNDPTTNSLYKIVESDPKSGEVQYKTSYTCGSNSTIIAGSRRQFATRVLLSDGTFYCAAN